MVAERADVVVVGGGLLGLATAYALRGRREVVVIERETVGNRHAGSHGRSRVFRLGYPDPFYVQMAQHSREVWRALERDTATTLLHETGQLSFGPGAGDVLAALRESDAPVSELTAADVAEQFPMFEGCGAAVFEPASAVIDAASTLATLRTAGGAEVREHTLVEHVGDRERGVRVETSGGPINAKVAVICAGPWTGRLRDIGPSAATLETVAYLRPVVARPTPIFIAHAEPAVYGLPTPGSELYKIALHHGGVVIDLDSRDRDPDPRAVAALESAARDWLRDFDPVPVEVETCVYDNTSDEDFVVHRSDDVVVGAGTSGHGFKFGPLLGRILADLVEDVPPSMPLERFAPNLPPAG